MRSVTCSTVPMATPRSTASPMPYWSSISMKKPATQSFTRFCAPKPRAMPAMPAPAISGARSMPTSPSTSRMATTQMTTDAVLATTLAIDVARAVRRGSSSGDTTPTRSSALLAASRSRSATWRMLRRMARRASRATMAATIRITIAVNGLPITQSASPASVALLVRSQTHSQISAGSAPHASTRAASSGGIGATVAMRPPRAHARRATQRDGRWRRRPVPSPR